MRVGSYHLCRRVPGLHGSPAFIRIGTGFFRFRSKGMIPEIDMAFLMGSCAQNAKRASRERIISAIRRSKAVFRYGRSRKARRQLTVSILEIDHRRRACQGRRRRCPTSSQRQPASSGICCVLGPFMPLAMSSLTAEGQAITIRRSCLDQASPRALHQCPTRNLA